MDYSDNEKLQIIDALQSSFDQKVHGDIKKWCKDSYDNLPKDIQKKLIRSSGGRYDIGYKYETIDIVNNRMLRIYKRAYSKTKLDKMIEANKDPLLWLQMIAMSKKEKDFAKAFSNYACYKVINNLKEGKSFQEIKSGVLVKSFQAIIVDKKIKKILCSARVIDMLLYKIDDHMTEEQKLEYNGHRWGRLIAGKIAAKPISSHRISNRLGASGLSDLANQASKMPSGAGGSRPRDNYTGVNKPKPPRNG